MADKGCKIHAEASDEIVKTIHTEALSQKERCGHLSNCPMYNWLKSEGENYNFSRWKMPNILSFDFD